MLNKKLIASLIAAAALTGAAGTAAAHSNYGVYVTVPPPPVRYEVVPAPRYGYVWAPGYWDWRGHRHVWVSGYWVPARTGYYYHPYRWVNTDGRWYLDRGRWSRHADWDRDGVPNRYDRRPNNPYRY